MNTINKTSHHYASIGLLLSNLIELAYPAIERLSEEDKAELKKQAAYTIQELSYRQDALVSLISETKHQLDDKYSRVSGEIGDYLHQSSAESAAITAELTTLLF